MKRSYKNTSLAWKAFPFHLQTFSREECYENGEAEVRVRVNNIQQGLVTYWDLPKFESRLVQMRDIYQVKHH